MHRASPSLTRLTYSYDANGNLALIDNMGTRTTYSWDVENRVTQVAPQGGTTNLMVYDGDGKRRAYTDSVMVRTFLWDGENIARQTQRDYTYNPQGYGELISMGADEDSYFYHYDGLGSTDRVTGADEGVVNQYLYRAFGEQTDVITEGISNRFTWVGRLGYYREPDVDTYWLRARVYDPQRGRFVSRDLLLDYANRYQFPTNSPLMWVDPSGEQGYRRGAQRKGKQGGTASGSGEGAAWDGQTGAPDASAPAGGAPVGFGRLQRWMTGPCEMRKDVQGHEYITIKPSAAGYRRHVPAFCWDPHSRRKRSPACCRWDYWHVFISALIGKCGECWGGCERESYTQGSEIDPSPMVGFARCVVDCVRSAPKAKVKSGIDPREEYESAVRKCVISRKN